MFLLRCVVELAQWVADLPWVVEMNLLFGDLTRNPLLI
jgi:hypothetical protein